MRALDRAGMTIIEIMIVMMLVIVLCGGAAVYYGGLVSKARGDRAAADLRQLAKILVKYEQDRGSPITTYGDISDPPELHNMMKLIQYRMVTEIPEDPWGNPYLIDISDGRLYSQGEVIRTGGVEFRADDVEVYFRPRFRPVSAEYRTNYVADQVAVEFSRPLERSTIVTDAFSVPGVTTTNLTTVYVDQFAPTRAVLQYDCLIAIPTPTTDFVLTVHAGVKSFDGAEITSDTSVAVDI